MIYVHIVGRAAVPLWGLEATTRVARQLRQFTAFELLEGLPQSPLEHPLLVVHAGYLFELRTLEGLHEAGPGHALRASDDGGLAAALVAGDDAPRGRAALVEQQPQGLRVLEAGDLNAFDGMLRKAEPPLLARVDASSQERLESVLYGNSYKGITDLVTKWWWPRPARVVVGWCARLGITPNMVTLTGFALMLASCWWFYQGQYVLGLVSGWIMTFLDTVDGKLARVTVQSSKLGHALDHGMDILHPPFWYVFWGVSLAGGGAEPLWGVSLATWSLWVLLGYVGGRIAEGLFDILGECSLFAWRPFDAYNRLVTARRNPSLILLSASVLAQRPDWGFYAVVLWTLVSTALLFLRLLQAAWWRWREGPVRSWLMDPAQARSTHPQAFRRFSGTRSAYGSAQQADGAPSAH
ncbi:MAG: CDP-alcohol phosphatidyltransferase family protein [Pseudomonadota bacterium]